MLSGDLSVQTAYMPRLSNDPSVITGRASVTIPLPARERLARLTNGRYAVCFSGLGSGYSDWRDVAVTRASFDPAGADGFYIFFRDLDDNFVWSAGYEPTRVVPDRYEFYGDGGMVEIVRLDRQLECRLSVCVAPQFDCELRRCRLTNTGNRTRRIELTSYLEWVLTGREADASHPCFSKLFVETEYCAESTAIIARRRPRSSDERPVWGFHALACDLASGSQSAVQFETSRVAFIGRGRTPARPTALDRAATLSGHLGPVLDPIASLRTAVSIPPGRSCDVAFGLGAASSRDEIVNIISACSGWREVIELLDNARRNADLTNGDPAGADGYERVGQQGERRIIHPPHPISPTQVAGAPVERKFFPASVGATTTTRGDTESAPPAPLQFDNGYGGFSADGREYVIRIEVGPTGEHRRPPMPWVNVVANEKAGFIVSESGAGYTWCGNSRLNRLTAWHNDPVCDPHSEAIWIRDEDAGDFWSVTPGPTPAPAAYVVRHGFGYTVFELESRELLQTTTTFMAGNDPVKLTRLRLVNRSGRPRRLSVVSYAHWALGDFTPKTSNAISTSYDTELRAILATNPRREPYSSYVSFSAVAASDCLREDDISFTCDRTAFLGESASLDSPDALTSWHRLDRRASGSQDPCTAWQIPIELPPDGECECYFLLGEAADRNAVATLINKYRSPGDFKRELVAAKAFWLDSVSTIQIETPDREIDLMVNGWLTYQNLSCRMWARSAYYQPGGAFGFRDQLQDAAALELVRPDLTRAQIVRHAGQQFMEGDVLHWWHPDTGYGLRTRFSDDLLWLPYVTATYIHATGDEALWDELAPFIVGPQISAGNVEIYCRPTDSDESGTIYEHCCRAIDRALTTGAHGLPLIGCGDWNDGFSRVGRLGHGESVWLGFFIHYVLGHLMPVCAQRGDDQRVAHYTAYRERLTDALNADGWDGRWFRRAYYDHGEPIGSAQSEECQIDALAQAWAVLSRVAPPDRANMAMDAVDQRLVCRDAGMIKLLTPPFDRTPNDPGYIKGYLPGIRENGGQYTHGVLWVVRALAEMGRGTAAVELLRMLSPVWHTASTRRTDVYQTEPYVVAADVYGEPPHVGRGGWTWYTGSAGWMFRVAVESIFGLTMEQGRTLVIKPAISASWPQCRITYRLPGEGTRYEIIIQNPSRREAGVSNAALDGSRLTVEDGAARVPLEHDGGVHHVAIVI
jgi:cyclic beta-1,2-glucan synthetase